MEKIEPDKTFSHETTPCQKTDFDKTQTTTTTKKNYGILTFFVGRFGFSSSFLHGFFPVKINIHREPLRIYRKTV